MLFFILFYFFPRGFGQAKTDCPYKNNDVTPLMGAAACGHLEVCRYLLEQGADRDKADSGGYTPLHRAAMSGHLKIAMLLMSYGADLNTTMVIC